MLRSLILAAALLGAPHGLAGLRALCQAEPTRAPAAYGGMIPWASVCIWIRHAPSSTPAPTFYRLV